MGYSGAGGKLIDEKNRSEKSRNTVPLSAGKNDNISQTAYIVSPLQEAIPPLCR